MVGRPTPNTVSATNPGVSHAACQAIAPSRTVEEPSEAGRSWRRTSRRTVRNRIPAPTRWRRIREAHRCPRTTAISGAAAPAADPHPADRGHHDQRDRVVIFVQITVVRRRTKAQLRPGQPLGLR